MLSFIIRKQIKTSWLEYDKNPAGTDMPFTAVYLLSSCRRTTLLPFMLRNPTTTAFSIARGGARTTHRFITHPVMFSLTGRKVCTLLKVFFLFCFSHSHTRRNAQQSHSHQLRSYVSWIEKHMISMNVHIIHKVDYGMCLIVLVKEAHVPSSILTHNQFVSGVIRVMLWGLWDFSFLLVKIFVLLKIMNLRTKSSCSVAERW